MNSKTFFTLFLLFFISYSFAQNKQKDISLTLGTAKVIYVPSIAQQIKEGTFKAVDPNASIIKANPKRMGANKTVPNKGLPKGKDPLLLTQEEALKIQGKIPSLVFDADTSNHEPSDPTAAVGMDYYLGAWNTGFRIFNKYNGSPATPEASLATIFPGNLNGDPVVLYDAAADRFIITEFSGWNSGSNGFNVAVCAGSDPINDGWHVYFFATASFCDYPKFSIWSDGYYVTTNTLGTNQVFALERSQMLNGNTAQFVGKSLPNLQTGGFYSPQIFNVCDANLPANGNATIVYFQDDAWTGVSTDHLLLWSFNVDWNNLANTSISTPIQIPVSPFTSVFDGGSFSNLTQPLPPLPDTTIPPDIDVLQATVMNQAQFRKFDTYNSAVFNFVVNTNLSNEKAGIRWYELRQNADGQAWYLYQEGTYTSPSKHAFNASMGIDILGNIGMGYSTVSASQNIAIHYTGRYANDPLGTMTVAEQLIKQGSSYDPTARYADYAHLTVDPADNRKFWHISEYFDPVRKDVVGVFQLAPSNPIDQGVIQINTPVDGPLSNSEIISVTVKNFGDYAISSGFMVNYQIDGGTIVYEAFNNTLNSGATALFTFATPADLSMPGYTYSIDSWTYHPQDSDPLNDRITKQVTNMYQNDLGISAITAPVSGNNLGNETITVLIENFGGLSQSNFYVSYTLNGGTPVTEQVAGTLNSGASMLYSFATQGDFSDYIDHNLQVTTSLVGDGNIYNDSQTTIITNSSCSTVSNTTAQTINPNAGSVVNSIINIPYNKTITDVNVTINITHGRDADLDVFLMSPDGLQVALTMGNGGLGQNYINTTFDDEASMPISVGIAPFTGSYIPNQNLSVFDGLATQGDWTLSIIDNVNGYGGTLTSWDLSLCYDPNVGIYDNTINSDDLIIATFDNNQYNISLTSEKPEEILIISIYNLIGQKLASNSVSKINGVYSYDLDMSYATAGVYLVRLSNINGNFGMVKRIIVK